MVISPASLTVRRYDALDSEAPEWPGCISQLVRSLGDDPSEHGTAESVF